MDRMHKGFVLTCVAVTIYALGNLGSYCYKYFTVTKPAMKERERLETQTLLKEGSSELLGDSAANVNV